MLYHEDECNLEKNVRDHERVIADVRQHMSTASICREGLLQVELPVNEVDLAGIIDKRCSNTDVSLTLKVFRSLHGTLLNSDSQW